MLGAGHILDMQKRNDQNRALQSTKNRFFKSGESTFSNTKKTLIKTPDISESELDLLKREIREQAKWRYIKQLALSTITTALVLVGLFLILMG